MRHLLLNKLASFVRYSHAEKNQKGDGAVSPPLGYKLVLTHKCNLRCSMCYEWGERGWCREELGKAVLQELDWSIIQKLMTHTGGMIRPYFILIGGEPLLYSRFRELALLFRRQRCVSIVCTNGLLLNRFLDVVVDNPYMTLLVSLDGPEEVNDSLRGRGVYRKVMENLTLLMKEAKPPYLGIEFTIRPENVSIMYNFCREMAKMGVDWILLNPSWFLTESQARMYEEFMQNHFGIMPKSHKGYLIPYPLDRKVFIDQMGKIMSSKWPCQISCYLREPHHIHTYLDTPHLPPANRFCYRLWSRMDVTPSGGVTPCILYPDLMVGDLNKETVMEAWNSQAFEHFRSVRRSEILPVCAKCNSLYLHDAKRKYL
jgi:MoaA/NifB/PqqE/SkfB family radical SAM enzyme